MSRQIICLKCGDRSTGLTVEDASRGWTHRRVFISLKAPEIRCDLCGEVIDGEIAVCITRIPPDRDIRQWETNYGRLMTPEEVDTYRKIAKS